MKRFADGSHSWLYLAVWYAATASLLVIVPGGRFGIPIWELPRSQFIPYAWLAAAFLISLLALLLHRYPLGWRALLLQTLFTGAVFGLVFLGLLLTKVQFSRTVIVGLFAASLVLVPAPHLFGSSRVARSIALVALLIATAAIPYARSIAEHLPSESTATIRTEYYNLKVDTYARLFAESVVYGGGLGRLGDQYLLVTGDGHLHLFAFGADGSRPRTQSLPYNVPLNGIEFAAFTKRPWATPYPGTGEGQQEAGPEIINNEWLRTHGVLIQEIGSQVRIFVSYNYWHAAERCFVERVSVLEGERKDIVSGSPNVAWRTLFETTPCLPVSGPDRRRGIPFVGYFGGGRMALLDPSTVLLTVGDFGFDGLAAPKAYPQDPTSSYGKTIAIDIATGRNSVFTLGHRNPQGLHIDPSGTIWSTEHGPRGGDELNRLTKGSNYGWPYATDGTDYGSFAWPLNKSAEEQRKFQPPVFAWVPSIAISNLVMVEGADFPKWRGDLLIATLNSETIFRARMRNDQVAYLEAIFIGNSIRDIIEGSDGRIVLWTDDQSIVSLRPARTTTGEGLFAEKCSGCHQSSANSGNRIGPNLADVVGRRVASLKNYPDYSSALKALGGSWTEKQLDHFLEDPNAAAPGTAMDVPGITDAQQRAAIVAYLKTLQ